MRHLGWQVLQKFLKERIWICQGQLHGMRLLWTGGAHVSSMQYALIAYDLQLILAQMGRRGRHPRPWRYHAVRYHVVADTRFTRRARRGRPAQAAPPPLEA